MLPSHPCTRTGTDGTKVRGLRRQYRPEAPGRRGRHTESAKADLAHSTGEDFNPTLPHKHVERKTAPSSYHTIIMVAIAVLMTVGPARAQEVVAVRAGRILPVSGPPIVNGVVLIRNGKITAIGKSLVIPKGARVIDARSETVMPGLVAAASDLGGRTDSPEAIAPDIRALDGYDPFANRRLMLERGITSAYVGAGSRRLVRGQGAVVKLAGDRPSDWTLRASADMSITLGAFVKWPPAIFKPPIPPTDENPILPAQRQMPSVRPSEFALLRQLFSDAKRAASGAVPGPTSFSVNVATIAPDRNPPPSKRDGKLRALYDVLEGKTPLRVRADTAADIRHALEFADVFHLRLVLEGGTEAYQLAPELARRRVPVVLLSTVRPGSRLDEDFQRPGANGRLRPDSAALLAKAGVSVAIASEGETDRANLLSLAAFQVSFGLSRETALRLVTLEAARALGVESRIGSLEAGKDADLLILSGDPLDTFTTVEMTLVNGVVAYQRAASANASPLIAIRAGRIVTVSQGDIANGVILVRDGKILAVRRGSDVPQGATVIEATHSTVMPGMMDTHSYLGLHADAEPVPIDSAVAQSGPASGRTKLLNALTPGDPAFAAALRAGVTTALLAPPTGGPMCGQAALLKTVPDPGHSLTNRGRVVRESAALCFNFQSGAPRRAQPWSFRDLLQSAKAYNQRRIQYNQDYRDWQRDRDAAVSQGKPAPKEPAETPQDDDLEPFVALFRGEIPAFVHVGRADEIVNALKLFRDEFDLPMTLVDAPDSFRVIEEIRKRGVSVALGPDVTALDRGRRVSNADLLARAGVPVLFQSSSASGVAYLRLNAAEAVRSGLDPVEAIRALTIYPARALKVESRLGSIEAGKDADLVFLDGDPLSMVSRVERVMVDGKVVYDGK